MGSFSGYERADFGMGQECEAHVFPGSVFERWLGKLRRALKDNGYGRAPEHESQLHRPAHTALDIPRL